MLKDSSVTPEDRGRALLENAEGSLEERNVAFDTIAHRPSEETTHLILQGHGVVVHPEPHGEWSRTSGVEGLFEDARMEHLPATQLNQLGFMGPTLVQGEV